MTLYQEQNPPPPPDMETPGETGKSRAEDVMDWTDGGCHGCITSAKSGDGPRCPARGPWLSSQGATLQGNTTETANQATLTQTH